MQNYVNEFESPTVASESMLFRSQSDLIDHLMQADSFDFLEDAEFTYTPVLTEELARALDGLGKEKRRAFFESIRHCGQLGDSAALRVFILLSGDAEAIEKELISEDDDARLLAVLERDAVGEPIINRLARRGKAEALNKILFTLLSEKSRRIVSNSKSTSGVGETILHSVVLSGNEAAAHVVFRCYGEKEFSQAIESQDQANNTVVHCAAEGGNKGILQKVLDSLSLRARSRIRQQKNLDGATPLDLTAIYARPLAMECLLKDWLNCDPEGLYSNYQHCSEMLDLLITSVCDEGGDLELAQARQLRKTFDQEIEALEQKIQKGPDSKKKTKTSRVAVDGDTEGDERNKSATENEPPLSKIKSHTLYYQSEKYQPNLFQNSPSATLDDKTNNTRTGCNNDTPTFNQ